MKFKSFILGMIFVVLANCVFAQDVIPIQTKRNAIVEECKKYIGTPYLYGGLTKDGIDCSGFVFTTVRDSAGIQLPRTVKALYSFVQMIPDSKKQKGDLVFFRTVESTISHVGIYIGKDQFMHSVSDGPNTGVIVSSLKEKLAKLGGLGTAGLIVLYSGIRGAELETLQIDWERGTFTVKNAKLKQSQKVNEKNLYRTVPIFPALYSLKSIIEKVNWRIPPKQLSSQFSAAIGTCTVKDLRHTFISRAREAGIENELVNVWTGHLPGKNQTANTYTHFSIEYQKKKAKKLKPY